MREIELLDRFPTRRPRATNRHVTGDEGVGAEHSQLVAGIDHEIPKVGAAVVGIRVRPYWLGALRRLRRTACRRGIASASARSARRGSTRSGPGSARAASLAAA